jgi:hypothetical protein
MHEKGILEEFLEEMSAQTRPNTLRFWSFAHPTLVKNTTKFHANTFGFIRLMDGQC